MKKLVIMLIAALCLGICDRGEAQVQDRVRPVIERPKPVKSNVKVKRRDSKYRPEKYGFKVLEKMKCPKFEVEMLDGSTVRIEDLKGKVVLIDFVGVHCVHCIIGMKKFDKEIFERFEGEDLVVLPIFVKSKTREEVQALCDRIGYHHPVGLDQEKKIGPQFYEGGIPRYFVVNRKGKIVYAGPSYHVGQFEEMLKRIDLALKKK